MYIEMTCNYCNERFNVNFDVNEARVEFCPKCKVRFSGVFQEELWRLTERFYALSKKADAEAKVHVITEGKKDFVIDSDIRKLHDLYNASSSDVRSRMTSLFDLFYLLMFHDCKGEKIENLDATIAEIRAYREGKISNRNKQYAKLLNLEQAEEDDE